MEEDKKMEFEIKKGRPLLRSLNVWHVSTAILGILLIISLFTGGLGIKNITGATTVDTLNVILLNDKRCKECDTINLVSQLKLLFPNLEVEEIDYSSKKGKGLYDDNKLDFLPALLFTEEVKNENGYSDITSYFEVKGKYLLLKIGANFDPKAEICDNNVDDDKNGKIDCEDDGCKGGLLCREEIKNKLDVFVMSKCPYGVKALDSMKEVLANFKNNIDFDIHFIASKISDNSFQSLHGQTEVDEDIRELCAVKYYPKDYEYMKYIWCRDKDISSANWEKCATEAFGSMDKIKTCFTGDEGKKLLAEDIKIAEQLKVSGSPTWLVNNRIKFSGIDAETIKAGFCSANSGKEGCSNALTSQGTVAGNC